jgi:transcriptional regulator with XRE-family HTH domain
VPQDTLGDRVTLALKRSGKDDAEIAEEANLGAAWVSAVKNDHIKNPPLDKLRALARACRVPLAYFTEPMGFIPIEEAQGDDWIPRALTDPTLSDEWKRTLEDMTRRDRDLKARDDPPTLRPQRTARG